jgi:hypothetical protein
MWKSDKNETFDVLFILFDVVIFVVVINSFRRCDNLLFDVVIIRFSAFWSTKKTISTFWSSTEFSKFFLVFDVVIFVVLTFSQKCQDKALHSFWQMFDRKESPYRVYVRTHDFYCHYSTQFHKWNGNEITFISKGDCFI